MTKFNDKGEEIPDKTRPEIPLGFKRPETLAEQVRRLVRSEQLANAAQKQGRETFEEADDFDVGDDYDPTSPYEEVFEPQEAPEVDEVVRRRRKKKKVDPPAPPEGSEGKGEEPPPKKGADEAPPQ